MANVLERLSPQVSNLLLCPLILFLLLLTLISAPVFGAGVTLAWDPVNSPSVAGYKVYYGSAAGSYVSSIDVGNTTTYAVSNLVEGATYHFAAIAYDAARTESGFSNDVTASVAYSAPIAQFSASTTSGTAPLAMNFTNASTGSITTYAWTFGDGTTGSSQNPAHVYSAAGVYTVGLTVTGPGGSNTKTSSNYITVSAPSLVPVAGMSASTTSGAPPLTVNFTSTSTGSITTYTWDFGDGGTSNAQNPSHVYAGAGVYTVGLTVTGSGGSNTKTNSNYITVSASQTAPGLVAAYSFDEGAGTTIADASGSGMTGTLVGSPAWVAGKNGTGLSFNGSSTYVDFGTSAALGFTGSMTVSAWVYETANVGDDGQIVAKSDGGSGWQLKSSPDTGARTFAMAITDSSGGYVGRYSSTVRALNTWYHVAGVYDATAQTLNIYVNGVLNNGTLLGTVPSSQRASTVAANIGRRTGGFNIQGIVDDVRVYGRALSVAEIQADMATPLGGVAGDTTPPSAPTNLTATAFSSSQINLSWTASTDNVAVTGYLVERCQGAGCTTFVQIAAPAGTTYNDTGRTANTSYSYRVRATDAVPNLGGYSNTASATTLPAADTTPPSAPTNLTATAFSSSQINLSWTASTDNVAVTGYLVERCQGVGCTTFAQIATPAGTTYNDTGRTANTSYSYRVRATDVVPNLSGYSNTASATTLSAADTTPPSVPTNLTATAFSSSQVNLSWTASTDNVAVTGYLVERCQGVGCTTFAQIATPAGTTYNDTGLTANTSYSYRVRATDAVPNLSGYSNTSSATTLSVDCPCSIWPSASAPTVAAATDARAAELGVRFKADRSGSITGIRFYKSAQNTGTHIASLWTSRGQLLARATFTNETASGWQEVKFAAPVAIAANVVYTASYHTDAGRYAKDDNYFATAAVSNGPLTALRHGTGGTANGVYKYTAASAFPVSGQQSTNFWVDVVFTPQ